MRNALDNILRPLMPKTVDELNILYFPYDGIFEQSLPMDNCRYYVMGDHQIYGSSEHLYGDNFYILKDGMLSYATKLDLVIANHRKNQLHSARSFANDYHLPLILFDHELPALDASPKLRSFVSKQFNHNNHVFSFDNLLGEEWYSDINTVCNYGNAITLDLEKDIFEYKKNNIAFIGDHNPSDAPMISSILSSHDDIVGFGYNGDLTQEYTSFEELAAIMVHSRIILFVVQESRPPLMALYAMAAGCVPVFNESRWSNKWFKDKRTVKTFKDVSEISGIVSALLDDEESLVERGRRCMEYIEQNFPQNIFREKYTSIVNQTSNLMYNRDNIL